MKKNTQQSKLKILGLKTKASFLILFGTILSATQVQAQTFSYTGAVQSVTLAAGSYQIEMWGADGGDALKGTGGKGGYSTGTLQVAASTTYYIYVGGKGSTATSSTPGGWNGGGSCLGTYSTGYNGGTGGGGTDIRTTQNTTYADRIIVAGGGGGATGYSTYTGNGGNGGGATGSNGGSSRGATYAGGGGSQTAGGVSATGGIPSYSLPGALGTGGNYTGTLGGTAGGGGYYGGGSGHWGGAGGGGSSYVGGVTSGVTIQSGQTGFVTNPDTTGNGRVTITASLLSTSDVSRKNDIHIYPNPATDFLSVTKVSDKATYTIYNVAGQEVSKGSMNGGTINVSALTKGTYVIAIEDKGNNLFKSKFIKK
ncbi:glycine-rich protein [Chryseobacterium gwangjuense]|uniref:glycine-rich protein n=1 Tax=Chryseobacterium gwangjuense TaxID=1069980 RepID=UPI001E2C3842|nr:glycine-rich protein [Chryseobacterium gwangjuense]MCE3074688.1 T9SS type A sorting domain-containing protein [Chryseobacterium gwangjuense]